MFKIVIVYPTNHGGVAVIAVPGTNLSPIDLKVDEPTTFEYVCVRATSGQFSAILLVIYRPGSSAVQLSFFDELSSVFDAVATYQEAVYVAGDVNIRLEHCDDPVTKQFTDLLSCYGFFVQPTTSTHQAGGTIDAVASISRLKVSVVDVGLSDHHLLTWSLPALKSPPSVQTVSRRCWCQLDTEQLCEQLLASPLCQLSEWPEAIDDMAAMYDSGVDCHIGLSYTVSNYQSSSKAI